MRFSPLAALAVSSVLLCCSTCALALTGCVDSPENPTILLGALGATGAGVPWLKARWAARRHDA